MKPIKAICSGSKKKKKKNGLFQFGESSDSCCAAEDLPMVLQRKAHLRSLVLFSFTIDTLLWGKNSSTRTVKSLVTEKKEPFVGADFMLSSFFAFGVI